MSYIDEVCDRCGSKRRVSKTWIENLDTFSGKSRLEVSQITCSNKVCQKAFEDALAITLEKSRKIKEEKGKQDIIRKANIQKNRLAKKS